MPLLHATLFGLLSIQSGDGLVLRPGALEGSLDASEQADRPVASVPGQRTASPAPGLTIALEVPAPGVYHLDLTSHAFDAFLVIEDADGRVLAEDDDGWLEIHARVELTLDPASRPVARVRAADGGSGPFVLTLREGPAERLGEPQLAAARCDDARARVAAQESSPAHPGLAVSLERLARCRIDADDLWEARAHYERALSIRQAADPPDPAGVAQGLSNLATLLGSLGEFGEAVALQERALTTREAAFGPDHPEVATSLNNLAGLFESTGQGARATPLFERALAIRRAAFGPGHELVSMTLGNLVLLRVRMGELPAAREILEQVLAEQEAALGPGDLAIGESLNLSAIVARNAGDLAGARELYERALSIFESSLGPAHPDVALVLHNLSRVLAATGETGPARQLLERALAIQESSLGGQHLALSTTLESLAMLHRGAGEHAEARRLQERSVAILERNLPPVHPALSDGLVNLGVLLEASGDLSAARTALERALAIDEQVFGPRHPRTALTLSSLAAVQQSMGDVEGGLERIARAVEILGSTLGPEHPDLAPALTNLGGALLDAGDVPGARRAYERALAIWSRVRPELDLDVAEVLENLSALAYRSGDLEGARSAGERALVIRETLLGPFHPDVANSLIQLATTLLDLGDVAAAAQVCDRAARGERVHLASELAALGESDAQLYLRRLRWQLWIRTSPALLGSGGSLTRAYEDLLAWKGQVLRAARARLRADPSSQAQELIARLRGVASALSVEAKRIPPDAAVLPEALAGLLDERARLERDLAALTSAAQPEPLRWRALRDGLPPRAGLVDFFVQPLYVPTRLAEGVLVEPGRFTEPQVTAWITRADEPGPVRLELGSAAGLRAAMSAEREEITAARGSSPRARVTSHDGLRALLWDPLAPHLEGLDTILLVPDGELAAVAFETLRDDAGRHLVERLAFVSLTDPTTILRAGEASPSARAPDLLVIGDVDFDHAGPAPVGPTGAPRSGRPEPANREGESPFPGLPGTGPEASAIAELHERTWPAANRVLLLGAEATEEAIKQRCAGPAMLHFATHGAFRSDSLAPGAAADWSGLELPDDMAFAAFREGGDAQRRLEIDRPGLLSGLACAGANVALPSDRDDGFLTAEEVGWLDLSRAELVVLSACDTGLGRPESGEGLLGLRRAFLTAGARTVISSLWAVPDQETAEFMERFYRHLWAEGLGKHAALRAAQLETIALNRARYDGDARPVTWGAFVLDGDWR